MSKSCILTIVLPGSKVVTKRVLTEVETKQGKKTVTKEVETFNKVIENATQVLNIRDISGMTDSKSIPEKFRIKTTPWHLLSINQRLEWHLREISKSLGGLKFSYQLTE